ncbi:HypC/HybG/HupF family hydrogenase formation chaperone [Herbaspirillum sp. RTI4]|uniref:HypC/HybG/HupF family hydrogenase formation chaperone n=1 Tax=Herbaspirillum sp. RTI4 TaxID=3048640 RepID=UPI002AB4FB71|nr:HypC/HybG/HupF family hydrogenase formation chaperone [Herbaspirillum sp. RTI4]MDY7577059.1 HypC/HybG/HupF family hydrogenase formation chaperone [Herbaspirillum sp. RTI4]MEA9982239.1 HypC/HybG/HupF family hydrogenase formation chaperone [Herbaspirillum sp. RTI4]
MCLAIPVLVVEILPNQQAVIDLDGVRKEISIALLDSVEVGDYVILHVGYAIGKLDAEEALSTLALFGELGMIKARSEEVFL